MRCGKYVSEAKPHGSCRLPHRADTECQGHQQERDERRERRVAADRSKAEQRASFAGRLSLKRGFDGVQRADRVSSEGNGGELDGTCVRVVEVFEGAEVSGRHLVATISGRCSRPVRPIW